MRMRRAVQAMLVLVGIWLVTGAPAHAAPAETGRYYMVGPPVGGQREYLYAIALRTLGNGNRYREIVELNTGRVQPDGETFTDGLKLNPGWVLVLPRDAKGQGVRIGPLPRVRARTTPPVTRSPALTQSAPTRAAAVPTRMPPSTPARSPATTGEAARPPATTEVAAPPLQGRTTRGGGIDPLVIRVGAGVLSVLLAVVAIVLLRPGRSGRGLAVAVAGDDGPWPPERHHTPAPGENAKAGPPTKDAAGPPATRPAPPPASAPASTSAPGAKPTAVVASVRGSGSALASKSTQTSKPAQASGPALTAASTQTATSARPSGSTSDLGSAPTSRPVGPVGGEVTPDVPRPSLPAGDEAPYLTAELNTDVGLARVRLIGVAAGRGAPYTWLGPGETAPPTVLPLVLGRSGPWRLHVDLARVPDVFTLVGPVAVCRRAAATLAGGLSAAGVGVAAVGEALGGGVPAGCRRLPGLPEPPGPGEMLPEPSVVFVEGPSPAGARGLAAATGGRCVPVVLGPVPAGRWSLQLDVDGESTGGD
ncbi:hypothetical protein ACFFKH_09655 [Micromonospora marina]|uniref:LysM domain-containing protein n=1 Tax=Micromonospora marina TaxID=307120 RepID=A0A1C4XB02_9ACTN|nr:hypothetical protein [Micromonospora marina]SCF05532.1 hypothetical protein GA0070215_10718 [Micromonospora marina]